MTGQGRMSLQLEGSTAREIQNSDVPDRVSRTGSGPGAPSCDHPDALREVTEDDAVFPSLWPRYCCVAPKRIPASLEPSVQPGRQGGRRGVQ